MASTYTSTTEPEKALVAESRGPAEKKELALGEVVLRFLVFASSLVAVVVMVTSNQTKLVRVPIPPFPLVSQSAKFTHSPAFIFFIAALSVAGLYSLITTLLSFYSLIKPGCCPKVISHFVIFDVLLLGIVASAVGSAGGVAYIGLKGNSHTRWTKVCNTFDDFCKHIGAALAVALFGAVVLTLLVLLSIRSLSKRIPKQY